MKLDELTTLTPTASPTSSAPSAKMGGISLQELTGNKQEIQQPAQKKEGFFKSLAKGIAMPFVKTIETAKQLGETGYDLAKYAVGSASGNEKMKQEALARKTGTPTDYGPLGKVSPIGFDEQGKELSMGKTIKQAVGTGAEIGSYFVGGGAAKSTYKAAKTGEKILQSGLEGAGVGALAGGGSEAQKEDSTVGSIATQGLIGTILGGAVGAAIPAAVVAGKKTYGAAKKIINPEVTDALTRAIKPTKNNVNFVKDAELAVPEITDTLKLKGVNPAKMTLNNLNDAILDTKKRVWDAYEKMLNPNQHATIDTNTIADKIESTITKRFEMQNPAKAEQIRNLANSYRGKTMTVGDAEQFLQEANAELHSYYAKNKVGQAVAAADPEVAHILQEANGLREQLYSKLSELTGGKANEIKKLYGALTNVGNEVAGRTQVFNRQAPASLQETIHYPLAVARGVSSALRGDVVGAAESAGQIALSKAMKEGNSTEGLIRKAFMKAAKQGKVASLPTGNQMEQITKRLALPAPSYIEGQPYKGGVSKLIPSSRVNPTVLETKFPTRNPENISGIKKLVPTLKKTEGSMTNKALIGAAVGTGIALFGAPLLDKLNKKLDSMRASEIPKGGFNSVEEERAFNTKAQKEIKAIMKQQEDYYNRK